jgi:hypothetical protein
MVEFLKIMAKNGFRLDNLQGAAAITSALHYRIRSCQILVPGKQQKTTGPKTRARSGSGHLDDGANTDQYLRRKNTVQLSEQLQLVGCKALSCRRGHRAPVI